MSYRPELSEREEKKTARRGVCGAIILLPTICLCLTSLLLSCTSGGRVIVSTFMLHSTYQGNFIGFVGFSDVAKSSCELERLRPRPSTYNEDQQALETRYFTNLRIYTKYWGELKEHGGDATRYPPPSYIPQTFNDAKVKYCRQ
jgi:hypothetical protein